MKRTIKTMLMLSLSAMLLCGCVTDEQKQQYRKVRNYDSECRTQETATDYPYSIYEVKYKGHDYIIFGGYEGQGYGMGSGKSSGVVHSPECVKCKEENE